MITRANEILRRCTKHLFETVKQSIQSLKLKSVLLVILGSLIQAFGICNIHAFSDVTEGGAIGLTLLIFHFTGISPAITSLIVNTGCYTLGWKVLGNKFLAYSAISVVSYSTCYSLIEPFAPLLPKILDSSLACSILGAIFIGVGAGVSVLAGGAPGGDDALAMSLSKKLHCKIQHIYLASDLIILVLSLSYIPIRKIAYSLLTVVLSGQMVGWIQRLKKEK